MTIAVAILAATPISAFALLIGLCALVVLKEGSTGLSEVAKVIRAFGLDRVVRAASSIVRSGNDDRASRP
jgi:hypothetical protein